MSLSKTSAAPSDFDFMIGDWDVRHRRLNTRLSGCSEWTEFSGLSSTRKILGGLGNVEDNILHFPEGDFCAAAFRSYNPEAKAWAIWWLDQRNPHTLDVPVVGGFSDQVGTFYARDRLKEMSIQVRFTWVINKGIRPVWEQAFSSDEGVSWETNWTMEFSQKAT